jgi:hypothetical protein
MNLQKFWLDPCLLLGLLCLGSLASACKDDDPCDPTQVESYGQCYPPPAATGGSTTTGVSGADSGGAPEAAAGAPAEVLDTPFGTPCADTTASSDCAGEAPVCADLTPLGQPVLCTQLDCADGEANAGTCPAGFSCFATPGYPSVCIQK